MRQGGVVTLVVSSDVDFGLVKELAAHLGTVVKVAEQDTIISALTDAITYHEIGTPSIGCPACASGPGRCADHAVDSPRLTAYRELLVGLRQATAAPAPELPGREPDPTPS